MYKITRKVLPLALALVTCLGLTVPAFADREITGESDMITYQWLPKGGTFLEETGLFGDKYAVTVVKEADREITTANISSSWDGEPVEAILGYAFNNCLKLTSVTIPDTVLAIGDGAFAASGLTEITIPASVSYLGSTNPNIFIGCRSLTKIEVEPGNPIVCSVDGVLFSKDMKTLISYPAAKPGASYTIPDTVTTICVQAFTSSQYLTSITIPASVTQFERLAFNGFRAGEDEYYSIAHTERPAPDQYTYGLKDIYYAGTEAQWNAISNPNPNDLIAVTVHFNSTGPSDAGQPAEPQQPVGSLAYSSTQNVLVDGKPVEFQAYALKDANGNDTNYVKLRDVAYALSGTAAQFSVGWDQASQSIAVTSGAAYEANGSEMSTPYSGNRAYTVSSSPLYIDGAAAELGAILLTDNANNGYTYFKLRDLGEALGFTVDWSAEKGIFIETK